MQFGPWMRAAKRQGGVISHAQLVSSGLSQRQIGRLVANGALLRTGTRVFRVSGAPVVPESALWVATLSTRGVLVGSAAAYLWRMLSAPPAIVEVAIPSRLRAVPIPGVRVHRLDVPDRDRAMVLGLPTTSRVRAAIDHLAGCSYPEATAFADRAISQRWLTPADLERRLEQVRIGNLTVRRVLRTVIVGAEAESERRLHRLLRRAQIAGWTPNYSLFAQDRLVARIDVAFVAQRLAIELDGFAYHSDHQRFQRDRVRQNELVALGWTVLRFTWADLVERPDYVLATIRRHLHGVDV